MTQVFMIMPHCCAQVLKHETKAQPATLGSSVMGYDDIYARYEPFLQLWRTLGAAGGEPPQAYIVTVDVSKAFDAVDVELLLQIIEPLLASPQYLVVKYAEVGIIKSGLKAVLYGGMEPLSA